MDKKELKEKIDEIAKKNCESWANTEAATEYDAVVCCMVRDIKSMIDEIE